MDEVDVGEILWRRTKRACKLAALFYVLAIIGFVLATFLVATSGKTAQIELFIAVVPYGLHLLLFAAVYHVIRATLWSVRGLRSPELRQRHPWWGVFFGGLIVLVFELHGWLNYFGSR